METPTQNDLLISFIIPAYNAENTLEASIDSIFDGNFQQGDEVIIVNDYSTDGTKEIAERICLKYGPSVKIINNEHNRGCPASRNVGIREAKNPLIFNLDADDILEKDSVGRLKKYLLENNADLAAFGEIHFFTTDVKKVTHKWLCTTGVLTLADYLSGVIVPGGNYIYTKTSWNKISGYWEYGKGLHEFWGFTLKQLANGSKVVVMPDSYYFHRYSHRSLYAREGKKINDSVEITNKFIEPIFNLFDEETKKYIRETPNWLNSLDKKPLRLKGEPLGKKGKLVYSSHIKQALYLIKKVIFGLQ